MFGKEFSTSSSVWENNPFHLGLFIKSLYYRTFIYFPHHEALASPELVM